MLTLKECTVAFNGSVFHASLELAQQALSAAGWNEFHAGSWRSAEHPGCMRDIRKRDRGFVVVETVYESR